jgi:hypothetical protein
MMVFLTTVRRTGGRRTTFLTMTAALTTGSEAPVCTDEAIGMAEAKDTDPRTIEAAIAVFSILFSQVADLFERDLFDSHSARRSPTHFGSSRNVNPKRRSINALFGLTPLAGCHERRCKGCRWYRGNALAPSRRLHKGKARESVGNSVPAGYSSRLI